MAKQAVDKSTKDMELVSAWEPITECREKIAALLKELDRYEAEWNGYMSVCRQLEAAGVDWAGTWYKDGKFLYLVYPDKGEGRNRVYVGADKDKQQEALAKLERGEQLDRTKMQIRQLERDIDNIRSNLNNALRGW